MASHYQTRTRAYRQRKLSLKKRFLKADGSDNGPPSVTGFDLAGTQKTVSRGHPWPPRSSGFHGDVGGDFFTSASYVDGHIPSVKILGNTVSGIQRVYTGTLCVAPAIASGKAVFPSSIHSSDDAMDEFGATAVARCKPTNSASDVTVFLGELLRDGIPRVTASRDWQNRAAAARAAGDDYLNAQFGWRPLLSDITNIAEATVSTDAALAQLKRDSGRIVRRQYSFPTEQSVEEMDLTYAGGVIPAAGTISDLLQTPGIRSVRVETQTSRWFSGAFTYHIPDDLLGSSAISELRAKAELIFGLSPTPEALWNLAPWSWAVDWFSNTGDVISNISDYQRYGLIMPYGYVMEHSIHKHTYSLRGAKFWRRSEGPASISLITETKKRRKANPFGFGVSWDGLDSFQTSILAALGMSRFG